MRRLPLLVVLLGLACATRSSDSTVVASDAEVAPIEWQQWSPAAFEHAKAQDKMILVDVGMEGCTACRWMDELTYTDPAVIARVREHFVPIVVDSEARPDLGDRYEPWGWPATIVMDPGGTQVLAIRGNKLPKNFVPILDELIAAKAAGTLTADGRAPIAVDQPASGLLVELRDAVAKQLDARWNEQAGDWGGKLRSPKNRAMQYAMLRAHARGETQWHDRAMRTLEGWRSLLDPVWGGIFVASFGDWSEPIPEKRLRHQAAALLSFANAYRLTGDEQWLTAAREVDRYVEAFLLHTDGSFYTSQEDVAPNLPPDMTAAQYYRELDDAGRRRLGVPPVDHAIYTDRNALAIRAYAELYAATGDTTFRDRAVRGGVAMLARQADSGVFAQLAQQQSLRDDDRMRPLPEGERTYLRPQAAIGLALLALSSATGEDRWHEAATRLAKGLRTTLEDPDHGGFFASDDASTEHIAPRRKPLEDNARAAQFLYLLSVLDEDEALAAAAERTLRAVASRTVLEAEGFGVGETAIALDVLVTDAVEMSIVGGEHDARGAAALLSAAGRIYEPRRVVHPQAPGRYPDQGRAAMFICNEQACSSPIVDPAEVAAQAARFAAIGDPRPRPRPAPAH